MDVEEAGLHGPGALEAQAGGDVLLDQVGFELVSRVELEEVGGAKGVELVAGLGLEDEDRGGGEAVADGVLGRAGAAFGGPGAVGLTKDSCVLCDQIRTVDERRFRQTLGYLPEAMMEAVEAALKVSLGLLD